MSIATALVIIYALANLVAAVMLVCMTQTTFLESSQGFRRVGWFTVAAMCGCFFYGIDVLGEVALKEIAELSFVETAKSVGIAGMLVLMRLKQIHEGRARHPRDKRDRADWPSWRVG